MHLPPAAFLSPALSQIEDIPERQRELKEFFTHCCHQGSTLDINLFYVWRLFTASARYCKNEYLATANSAFSQELISNNERTFFEKVHYREVVADIQPYTIEEELRVIYRILKRNGQQLTNDDFDTIISTGSETDSDDPWADENFYSSD